MDSTTISSILLTSRFGIFPLRHPDAGIDSDIPIWEQHLRFWRQDQAIQFGQSIARCSCGFEQVIAVRCTAHAEMPELEPHTVMRCAGEGCKARIELPGIVRTYGELAAAAKRLTRHAHASARARPLIQKIFFFVPWPSRSSL